MHKRIVSLSSLSITLTLVAAGCASNDIELEPDPEPLFVQPGARNPATPDTPEPEICNPAELHVVGSYSAGGGRHADGITGEATVRVTRPGPSVLVLSNYEPVHWTVVAEEGAVIERVILNGRHAGSATAPDGVPVDGISHESTGTYWPIASYWPDEEERNLDCADIYPADLCELYEENGIDWRVATGQPAWEVDTLVAEAERVTGAALTTFHGCGSLTEVTIAAHEDGGAPAELQGSCMGGEFDVYFAETPAELPVDGGETCGAPLPVRTVPTEGPCAGKAEAGSYQMYGCLTGGPEDESAGGIEAGGLYCEEGLENCLSNVALNPGLDFACTFDDEVIYASPVCEP
jgi:hypothetical protein